jgi:hypothetical protein
MPAPVVYLRHWPVSPTGTAATPTSAAGYLQTTSGPNTGNVVLMQPDGTEPQPHPRPRTRPTPAPPTGWLDHLSAGEGYADFRTADPPEAVPPRSPRLGHRRTQQEVLTRYRHYQLVDGLQTPAWLIVDSADATSEAVLGLAAYVQAGGRPPAPPRRVRRRHRQDGTGARRHLALRRAYALGAVRSDGTPGPPKCPVRRAATASTSRRLHPAGRRCRLHPHLLTATGPTAAGCPRPSTADRRGDARVRPCSPSRRPAARPACGGRRHRGQLVLRPEPADAATNPATGATDDGVSPDGSLNLNPAPNPPSTGCSWCRRQSRHRRSCPRQHIQLRDGQHHRGRNSPADRARRSRAS